MKKLFMALALGCAALVTLAGCGGGDNRTGNSVSELQEKYGYQWTDTSKPILNDEGAQAITFNIYSSKNASALDYNDMDVMKTIKKQTNVNVTWENVSETVYGQQKSIKLGNHKGIDAIYHAGMAPSEIIKYAKRKALLPISDYLEYMPNFKRILEERPDIKSQVTNASDGKIYSLPRVEEMGLKQNPNLLFLNAKWTKEAIENDPTIGITEAQVVDGLELTAAQMEKLLTYFKDHDMNGDGNTKDEFPLNFVYQNWQGNQCDLYGMFGINDNPDHRVIKDGKVTYTVLDERYREATAFIHDWIDRGLIDRVCLEVAQDTYLATGMGSEKYGAFYWWESATVVKNPEDYICCKPLKGADGSQTVCVSNAPEVDAGELIFFTGTPNVEVLLTYFDRYYNPELSAQINYGPIGTAFKEEKENGKLVAKEPPEGLTVDNVRLTNAPLGVCYLTKNEWDTVVEMEPRAQLRLDRLQKYAIPFVPENVKPIPNLQFTSEELNKLSTYEANINSYISRNLMSFLMNGVSEAQWNSFTTELQSTRVGLAQVVEVYQAAYDRYLGK